MDGGGRMMAAWQSTWQHRRRWRGGSAKMRCQGPDVDAAAKVIGHKP